MMLTCDGDRHVYHWQGADAFAPPPGTRCECGERCHGEATESALYRYHWGVSGAPERIWAYWDNGIDPDWDTEPRSEYGSVEYVRADVVQQQVADLSTRLDVAQKMILERDQRIARLEAQMGERHDLATLRHHTERAIAEARDNCRECREQAINWADLKCVGVESYVDEFGSQAHRVWIDEADPSAYRLRDFVVAYLVRHGFPDVHVMLEW